MMLVSKIKNNSFIAFLILLILVIGFLSYENAKDYSELKAVFELEKKELESELTNIIEDYEEASYKKSKYSLRLKDELHKVIKLRESVKNLKKIDYKFIRYYRKRTGILIEENEKLFTQINRLNTINNELISKNDSVKEALLVKEKQNAKLANLNRFLSKEKHDLKKKIATAEIIEISTIKAEAMKKKRNGKFTSTNRSNKVNAFKIEFDLLENKVVSSGPKEVYIQVIDTNKKVIAPYKKVSLQNNKKIWCSDVLIAEYNNEQLSMISFVNINSKINAGIYHINTFVNGIQAGNKSLALK
ncbi:hypothetical protein Q4517_02625 [Tenacibaculum sp. 1_MG-2023]|uniref:hypothetical protein n=1 Tax=Tenacibaculum sp. 1_MG-2023 TaxID=3062653 RepID=UPI0026E4599A|nr:hypothetical protein [Tenacibaculum sp. 1_MG-2023]MDO6674440.1 hypothetical protein [Tenacibaculum sp. 1_MG-2023]